MPGKFQKTVTFDEETNRILSKVPSGKRAEFIRTAIKHYAACSSLTEVIKRLEGLVEKLESSSGDEGCKKYSGQKTMNFARKGILETLKHMETEAQKN